MRGIGIVLVFRIESAIIGLIPPVFLRTRKRRELNLRVNCLEENSNIAPLSDKVWNSSDKIRKFPCLRSQSKESELWAKNDTTEEK